MAEDTLGHVLDILSYFDRPRNAIASGVYNLVDNDPESGFLGGAWQGLKGDREVSWGDVVGISAPGQQDSWGDWGLKGGSRLGLDMALDPLNLLFGAGAITKALGLSSKGVSAAGRLGKLAGSEKASEWFHGTGIGKVLAPGLPAGSKYDDIKDLWLEIQREGSKIPVREEAQRARGLVDEALGKTEGIGNLDIYHGLQYADEVTPEVAQIAGHVRPLQEMNDLGFRERNDILERFGQEKRGELTGEGYTHVPNIMTPEGLIKLKRAGDTDITPDALKRGSRTIKRWTDEYGYPMRDLEGELIVGKIDDPRTKALLKETLIRQGKSADEVNEAFKRKNLASGEKQLVFESPASMKDVSRITAPGTFIEDPIEALTQSIIGQQAQTNTLKLMDKLREKGLLINKAIEGAPDETWRSLKIKGFRDWVTTPQIANWLENLTGTPTDWLGKTLQGFGRTPMGEALGAGTQWWKRNTLGLSPSFHFGNALSDTGMRYNAGQNPIELVTGLRDARRVLKGTADDVITGMDNPTLLRELELRGLPVSGWGGQILEEESKKPSRFREMGEGKVASTLGTISEKWRDVNDWAFKKGNQYIEAPGRVATAIDYLKKNAPEFASMNADDKAKVLDKAADFAKKQLVDYGDMSATFKELQKYGVPFLGWQYGITKRTLEQAMTHPERLGRFGRALDTVFDPLPAQDKEIADKWIQENAPVTGALGWEFPYADGNKQMAQIARFLPQGNLEALFKRPADSTWSSINPFIKSPVELAMNYSAFKDQPIDKLATGFGEALTNPILGGPWEPSQGLYAGAHLPAGWEYLLSQSPIGGMTRKVNDLARGLGAFEDPNKPIPQDSLPEQVGSAAANFLTGTRFYGFDPAKFEKKRTAEKDKLKRQMKSDMRWADRKGDTVAADHYRQLLDEMNQEATSWFTTEWGG